MGLIDSVFGNKSAKEGAKLALARPTDIFAPGFGSIDLEWGKKTPATVGFNLDPRAANLNDLGYGLTEGAIGSLLSGGYSPGGYYGLGQQYDPFVSALFGQPGAASAFLDPRMAQGFQNLGLGMLGTDYRDIAARETDLLRQQARPYEDLATTRALDRLMSRGQLGISTTLNDTFRSLNDQFAQQDLGFQLAGLDRADALRNADRGLGLAETAGGLRTQGFGEILGLLGAGTGITSQNFNQLMQLLSGATAVTGARSGAGANAGQLLGSSDGLSNLWNLAGSALGGWASGGFRTPGNR